MSIQAHQATTHLVWASPVYWDTKTHGCQDKHQTARGTINSFRPRNNQSQCCSNQCRRSPRDPPDATSLCMTALACRQTSTSRCENQRRRFSLLMPACRIIQTFLDLSGEELARQSSCTRRKTGSFTQCSRSMVNRLTTSTNGPLRGLSCLAEAFKSFGSIRKPRPVITTALSGTRHTT